MTVRKRNSLIFLAAEKKFKSKISLLFNIFKAFNVMRPNARTSAIKKQSSDRKFACSLCNCDFLANLVADVRGCVR